MSQLPLFDEVEEPPWDLVGQGWWFIMTNPASLDLTTGGWYHPLELRSTKLTADHQGEFKGGLAMAQVFRYTDSPVGKSHNTTRRLTMNESSAGPYDELIIVPGSYTLPGTQKQFARISRIYVSTERSVYNGTCVVQLKKMDHPPSIRTGRKNWNIPKHLARFKFTPGPSNSTKIEVFAPEPSVADAFFSTISTPAPWFPSFPFRASWIPQDTTLVQPPLPTVADDRILPVEGEDRATLTGGREEWISILCSMSGKMRVVHLEPALDGKEYGDGVGAPKIRPWRLGLEWLPGMKLTFPKGEVVTYMNEDKKKK